MIDGETIVCENVVSDILNKRGFIQINECYWNTDIRKGVVESKRRLRYINSQEIKTIIEL